MSFVKTLIWYVTVLFLLFVLAMLISLLVPAVAKHLNNIESTRRDKAEKLFLEKFSHGNSNR